MATKLVKLCERDVANLKRDLKNLELDTSGTKALIQQNVRDTTMETGDDHIITFDKSNGSGDLGKILNNLEETCCKIVTV